VKATAAWWEPKNAPQSAVCLSMKLSVGWLRKWGNGQGEKEEKNRGRKSRDLKIALVQIDRRMGEHRNAFNLYKKRGGSGWPGYPIPKKYFSLEPPRG